MNENELEIEWALSWLKGIARENGKIVTTVYEVDAVFDRRKKELGLS